MFSSFQFPNNLNFQDMTINQNEETDPIPPYLLRNIFKREWERGQGGQIEIVIIVCQLQRIFLFPIKLIFFGTHAFNRKDFLVKSNQFNKIHVSDFQSG